MTSWNELRNDGMAAENHNFLHPEAEYRQAIRVPAAGRRRSGRCDIRLGQPSARPDPARRVPRQYLTLGADGFGISDTRRAARRYFHIDAESIAKGVLQGLVYDGKMTYLADPSRLSTSTNCSIIETDAGPRLENKHDSRPKSVRTS